MSQCTSLHNEDCADLSLDKQQLVDNEPTLQRTVHIPSSQLTIQQIRKQIPDAYFDRSTSKGLWYLARDLLQVAATAYIMCTYVGPSLCRWRAQVRSLPADDVISHHILTALMKLITAAVWGCYWFVQGLNGTALWVLAHECGHQGFSPSNTVNDTIGFVLHSALLVPYHSWRITHGLHHKHTNHLSKDTVFVPDKEDHVMEVVREIPIYTFMQTVFILLFGWPGYLLFTVKSQDYGRSANHFNPNSPFFRREDRQLVILSGIGVVAMLSLLSMVGYHFGWQLLVLHYVMPYMIVNMWLVIITYLQHTDLTLPHYDDVNWTFPRGALATIDRDYGSLLNGWLHHIHDAHVVHHLFSMMPFYHCEEVTRLYLKDIIGEDLYRREEKRSIWACLWEARSNCHYVVLSEGICVYRSHHRVVSYGVVNH